MIKKYSSNNPLSGIIALLFIVFLGWLVFNFVKGLFSILTLLALPLFVLALILNYRVVIDHFKWLWGLIKKDTGKGVLYSIGTVVAYPVVSAYLFFKAFTTRKQAIKENSKKKGEYLSYEESEEEDDFLELPDVDYKVIEEKQTRPNNKYDDLF
jgi:hypothetical protein